MTEHVPASEIERIVGDDGALARIQAEAWPCANYTAPVTCLHAGTTTPCDWCREAGAGAEQRGAERERERIAQAIEASVNEARAEVARLSGLGRDEAARAEALAPILALAEEWERSPWDWLRTTAAPALRAVAVRQGGEQ